MEKFQSVLFDNLHRRSIAYVGTNNYHATSITTYKIKGIRIKEVNTMDNNLDLFQILQNTIDEQLKDIKSQIDLKEETIDQLVPELQTTKAINVKLEESLKNNKIEIDILNSKIKEQSNEIKTLKTKLENAIAREKSTISKVQDMVQQRVNAFFKK
jgi:predicted RNase H-like nuclease (RuvC/YqgF family)